MKQGTFVAQRPPYHPVIAVVMPYLFFSESALYSAGTDVMPRLMQSIEAEVRRQGMSLLLYLDNHEPSIERQNIANLLERKVDGVILNYIGVQENLDCFAALQEAGIPLVLVDRYVEGIEQDYVVTDNTQGAYRATKHLIKEGLTHLTYITSPPVNTTLQDRYTGYRQAMEESGLPPNVLTLDVTTASIDPEPVRAYRLAKKVLPSLLSTQKPLGILTSDAPTLTGVWQALEEADTPHDQFGLACFDDPFLALPAPVGLIKILQPLAEIGRLSVEILQQKLTAKREGRESPPRRQIRLDPDITGF